jgi:hypothetical protein
MSIILSSDTDFAPSRLAEHYTPPLRKLRIERIVLVVSCFTLFAALGVIFFVGLSLAAS